MTPDVFVMGRNVADIAGIPCEFFAWMLLRRPRERQFNGQSHFQSGNNSIIVRNLSQRPLADELLRARQILIHFFLFDVHLIPLPERPKSRKAKPYREFCGSAISPHAAIAS